MSKNFGHRGFSGQFPENTMLAFRKAIEAGCDGIELDVHLSRDGQLVIIHDELVDRTTDASGWVADYSLEDLKAMDASAGFKGIYGKNEIPTLREYFELVKNTDIVTNIELKTGVNPYPGIEKKTLDMIDEYGLRDKIIISSFNHYSVMRMKELAPDMTYGFLEESWVIDFAAYAAGHGVQALHPIFNAIDEDYVKAARKYGLTINTWTVNTEEDIRRMKKLGIDGIIGNHPDLCGKILREG